MNPYETDLHKLHCVLFCSSISKNMDRCRFKPNHTGMHLPILMPRKKNQLPWHPKYELPRDTVIEEKK